MTNKNRKSDEDLSQEQRISYQEWWQKVINPYPPWPWLDSKIIGKKEQLEKEVPKLREKIQKLETENKDLREKNDKQQKELIYSINLRKDANDWAKKYWGIDTSQSWKIADLKERIDNYIFELENENFKLRSEPERQKLEKEAKDWKEKYEQRDQDLQNYLEEHKVRNFSELDRKITETEQKGNQYKSERDQAKVEINQKNDLITQLGGIIKNKQNEIDTILNKWKPSKWVGAFTPNDLNNNIQNVFNARDKLQQERDDARKETSNKHSRFIALTNEKEALKKQLERLEKQDGELGQLQEKIRRLEEKRKEDRELIEEQLKVIKNRQKQTIQEEKRANQAEEEKKQLKIQLERETKKWAREIEKLQEKLEQKIEMSQVGQERKRLEAQFEKERKEWERKEKSMRQMLEKANEEVKKAIENLEKSRKSSNVQPKNYYDILGVSPNATLEEIKKVYWALAKIYSNLNSLVTRE